MVYSVEITTPDGVGRVMRLTHGAQKRFSDNIGGFDSGQSADMVGIYTFAYISKNLIDIAYYMMYDEQGKPPADLTLEAMREQYAPDDPELFGAVCEAMSKGKKKREEAAQQIQDLEQRLTEALTTPGSKTGPSPVSISDSKGRRRPRSISEASSGTSTPQSSLHSLSSTPNATA